ncbi:MAG: InlB B-repeat-containing protein [Kiritimatiellaeota bacterium]|nr:InlB B-repeat-containing protein [Kiritimatiellota bacterium]
MKKIVWFIAGLLAAVAANAATNYVSGTGVALRTAVNNAVDGDVLIVSPGTYWAIDSGMKKIRIESTGGASATFINGGGTNRCATLYVMGYNAMATNTVLVGFTLTNGNANATGVADNGYGGGALGGTLINCTLSGNQANDGGGAYEGTLINCTLSGNKAYDDGGGAYEGTLTGCTLSGNTATYWGGGARSGTLTNCTLSGNEANYGGGTYWGTLTDCTLSGNTATYWGGGARGGRLTGCTLSGNEARYGGGAYEGTLTGCTLSGNEAQYNGGGAYGSTLTGGCTLSGNEANNGGGAYNSTLTGCTLSGNKAYGDGGGAYEGTLSGCTLSGNEARYGGGAYSGTLTNCTLSGNTAENYGGGAYNGTLTGCTLSGNFANFGGGAYNGTLTNCTLSGNVAYDNGGGARSGTLYNCFLSGNEATYGGGAYASVLHNCVLSGNLAETGGGVFAGTLNNCTVSGNRAYEGGGAHGASVNQSRLNNCVVWGNAALSAGTENYGDYCVFASSCTSPAPSGSADGGGNVSGNPLFAPMDLRLSPGSPCLGAGATVHATHPTDILGNDRIVNGLVDMGAYQGAWAPRAGDEHVPRNVEASRDVRGAVRVSWEAPMSGGAVLYAVCRLDEATGKFAPLSGWLSEGMEFVDKDVVPGVDYTYAVVAAFDAKGADTSGLSAPATGWCRPLVFYVNASQPDDSGNGRSERNAKKYLQSGVDLAVQRHDVVMVLPGDYEPIQTQNRLIVIESTGGAENTFIKGGGTNRCATLGATAEGETNTVLVGFTLTGGYAFGGNGGGAIYGTLRECVLKKNEAAGGNGGGAYGSALSGCVVEDNKASYYGGGTWGGTLENCTLEENEAGNQGGGAYGGTLNNCTLKGNVSVGGSGGGAYNSTLNNCLLTGNESGSSGGGAYQGLLVNCTVAGNKSNGSGGGVNSATVRNCVVWGNLRGPVTNNLYSCTVASSCSSPSPAGDGNIGEDPLFVDAAGGDFRLSEGSPCVSAGSNDFIVGKCDLVGNPRIMGARVNMGAYESIGFDEVLGFPGLAWRTGGDAEWFAQSDVTCGGEYAAQSGAIGDDEQTWIETTLECPGTLRFSWRASSEINYDWLKIYVDGVFVSGMSGDQPWMADDTLAITEGGTVVRWSYEKDREVEDGLDCGWLADVAWFPTYAVTFDADGGTPPTQTKTVTKGEAYGELPAVAREGWDFTGWFAADGSEVTDATVVTASAPHTLTARWAITLGGAVDAPQLAWTTGGNAPWFAQDVVTYYGDHAAQSGHIGHNEESWIETTVTGEGTFSFWWKVSSENGYDFLVCYVNGTEVLHITGEDGWKQETLNLVDSETTIRWSFKKDKTDILPTGEDCGWLDLVTWAPTSVGDPALLGYPAWRAYYGNLPDNTDNYALWLAGLIPGDPTSKFRITNFAVNATGNVTALDWTPDLRPHRVYTVLGKTNLMDNAWGVTNNATHFFKVRVALP